MTAAIDAPPINAMPPMHTAQTVAVGGVTGTEHDPPQRIRIVPATIELTSSTAIRQVTGSTALAAAVFAEGSIRAVAGSISAEWIGTPSR